MTLDRSGVGGFAIGLSAGLIAILLFNYGRVDLSLSCISAAIMAGSIIQAVKASPPDYRAKLTDRWGWKLWFAILLLMNVMGWWGAIRSTEPLPLATALRFPLDAAVLAGLFSYAFRRPFGKPWIWQVLAAAVAIDWAHSSFRLWQQHARHEEPASLPALGLALVLIAGISLPGMIGLLKLGQR